MNGYESGFENLVNSIPGAFKEKETTSSNDIQANNTRDKNVTINVYFKRQKPDGQSNIHNKQRQIESNSEQSFYNHLRENTQQQISIGELLIPTVFRNFFGGIKKMIKNAYHGTSDSSGSIESDKDINDTSEDEKTDKQQSNSEDSNRDEQKHISYTSSWRTGGSSRDSGYKNLDRYYPTYLENKSKFKELDSLEIREASEIEQEKVQLGQTKPDNDILEELDLLQNRIKAALTIQPPKNDAKTPLFDQYTSIDTEKKKKVDEWLKLRMTKKQLFPGLPNDADRIILDAFQNRRVFEINNVVVEPRDLKTLVDRNWLNDEVVNYYMQLIMARCNQAPNKYPSVFAFNTFFYPTLLRNGYEKVRRWTKKTDIFKTDFVLIPVHLGNHWCCCVVDVKKKTIFYYDSMLGNNNACSISIPEYLLCESKTKRSIELDLGEWSYVTPKDIPTQNNGYDCGVFACTFAELSSRRQEFTFSQSDIKFLRKKMMVEIIQSRLLSPDS
ncbi:Sentrin-specific protease [Zancudomyces culisetae]|uniref:Sentrin-specific protease n=1 Tax=Zancudomyces culisetae TaxID=1213189 RepID=A0A1R1PRB7_ZANCU|nr:Sentrin-specific protease [Zancudomyces culisetae]OMH83516.1 Sentrin-specific protease [Zancudomyces culisetae]|eukprot:OMH82927.1 Sentrin-specific protease [Zancudomyces culisetae]